jgi:hypothetical protein
MILEVKDLLNKAKTHHQQPQKAIDELAHAIWLLSDIVQRLRHDLDDLKATANPKFNNPSPGRQR